eukprot:2955816-Prymnesium_polylepis.1
MRGGVTSDDLLTVVCRGAWSRPRSLGRPVADRTPQCKAWAWLAGGAGNLSEADAVKLLLRAL